MRKFTVLFLAMCLVLGLAFVQNAVAENIPIVNGDIEDVDLTGGGTLMAYTTSYGSIPFDTGVPGWYLSESSEGADSYTGIMGNLIYPTYYPVNGSQAVFLQGNWGTFAQNTVVLEQDYTDVTVTFSIADYAGQENQSLEVQVYGDAGNLGNLYFGGTVEAVAGRTAFIQYTSDATDGINEAGSVDMTSLAAGTYYLVFYQYSNNKRVMTLDDVSMAGTPVPEPSVLAIAISALLLCAWRRRR